MITARDHYNQRSVMARPKTWKSNWNLKFTIIKGEKRVVNFNRGRSCVLGPIGVITLNLGERSSYLKKNQCARNFQVIRLRMRITYRRRQLLLLFQFGFPSYCTLMFMSEAVEIDKDWAGDA